MTTGGIGVLVGMGVVVATTVPAVGVHEGTNVNLRVVVGVGGKKAGFKVEGGNGLSTEVGFKNMITK